MAEGIQAHRLQFASARGTWQTAGMDSSRKQDRKSADTRDPGQQDSDERQAKSKQRRQPRRITPAYLERAALFYLERYVTSEANLRRVLRRKIKRSLEVHGGDLEEAERWIDELIVRLRRNGFLDDAAYAQGLARSLHRRGKSARAIEGKLREKGVEAGLIEEALGDLEAEKPNSEFRAAVAFARRRRLGPFREEGKRKERRERDLAALGRQGFSYALARCVVEAEDVASLEDMLAAESQA